MRHPYAELFPEEYVCHWEREFRAHAIDSYAERLTQTRLALRRSYRRGTEYAGAGGRLARGVATFLHDAVAWMQDRSLRRVLNAYPGNTDCYRTGTL
jgi:hypothetical protein